MLIGSGCGPPEGAAQRLRRARRPGCRIRYLLAVAAFLLPAPGRAATNCPEAVEELLKKAIGIELSEQEKLDLLYHVAMSDGGLTERQGQWLYKELKGLRQRIADRTEKEVVVSKKHGANPWTTHDVDTHELDYAIEEFEKNKVMDPLGFLPDWINMKFLRAGPESIAAVEAAPDAAALEKVFAEKLHWTAALSADGRIVTYSNAGYTQPIRLLAVSARGGPLPAGVREGVANALKRAGPYIEPEALPRYIADSQHLNTLSSKLETELGWTSKSNKRASTITFTDPLGNVSITVDNPEWGATLHLFTAEEQQGFARAISSGVSYTTPDAQKGLALVGSATPQELAAAGQLTNLNDARSLFDKLEWTSSFDKRTSTVTYTNPVYKNTVTFYSPDNGSLLTPFSEADRSALRTAVATNNSYVTSEAKPLLERVGKAMPEELEKIDHMTYSSDARSLFDRLDWKSKYDPRSHTVTYTNPVYKNGVTIFEVDLGSTMTPFTDAERAAIRDAVANNKSYATPEAARGLERIGKATPEELETLRGPGYQTTLTGTLDKMGWKSKANRATKTITYTNPKFKNTITIPDDVPIGGTLQPYSDAEREAITAAVRDNTSYAVGQVTRFNERLAAAKTFLATDHPDLAESVSAIERNLTPERRNAIEVAHSTGVAGPDGRYKLADLKKKAEILKKAGFSAQEREALFRGKIAGGPQRGDFGVDQYGRTLRWTGDYWATTDVFDRMGARPAFRVDDQWSGGRRTLARDAPPQRGEFRRDRYGNVKVWVDGYWAKTDVFDRMGKAISPGLAD